MGRRENWLGLAGYSNGLGLTEYVGNVREWVRGEVDAIRAAKGMKPMAWITDSAVRRSGEGGDVAIRYCVMCLADGDKSASVCVIDIGEEGVEAGYCKGCAETMQRQGHTIKPLPEGERYPAKGRGLVIKAIRKPREKLTPEQRAEIVASSDSAVALAERYGVHFTTIYDVRKKAKEEASVPRVSVEEEAAQFTTHVPLTVADLTSDTPVLSEEKEISIEEIRRMYPQLTLPDPAPPAPAAVDVVPADTPVAEPMPMSRNLEAMLRVIAEEDAPAIGKPPFGSVYHERETEPDTVSITVPLTHERANAIWGGLSLEEKATFCRTKIIERLELMA